MPPSPPRPSWAWWSRNPPASAAARFLLHWDGVTRKLSALDGRETAPKSARPDLFLDADGKPVDFIDAALSGRSVGVPGVLRVLELAHRREGRLPWAELFQPAIELAENGFAVPPQLAEPSPGTGTQARSGGARLFLRCRRQSAAGRRDPAQSRLCRDPARDRRARRRRVLRRADRAGDRGRGERATASRRMSRRSTCWTIARASATRCAAPYRAMRSAAWARRPPAASRCCRSSASCGTSTWRRMDPNGAPALHLIAEASRLAFADRDRYVADADFVRVPTAKLLEASYLKARAGQIRSDRTIGEARAGQVQPIRMIVAQASQRQFEPAIHHPLRDRRQRRRHRQHDQQHRDGDSARTAWSAASCSTTSSPTSPSCRPRGGRLVANRVEPGKRPRSSMAPAIVFDQDGNPVYRPRLARRTQHHRLCRAGAGRDDRLGPLARRRRRRRPTSSTATARP